MEIGLILKKFLDNDIQKESTSPLHRWLVRPTIKGNKFSTMLFFITYFGICYYDALLWSYRIVPYVGLVIVRCLFALLLFIPNIIRFPFKTDVSFFQSYVVAILLVWVFGFADGLFNGPQTEKYERPGPVYLLPLFVFGYTIYLAIADYFGDRLGLYMAVLSSKGGIYPLILLFIGWPIITQVWYVTAKKSAAKSLSMRESL